MAYVFSDGFDGITGDILKYWSGNTTCTITPGAGRWGGNGLVTTGASGAGQLLFQFPQALNLANPNFLQYGGWFKFTTKPAVNNVFTGTIHSALNNNYFWISAATGQIFEGTQGGAAVLMANPNVCDNAWHFFETRVSTTVTAVWLDGILTYAAGTGSGSQNQSPVQFFIQSPANGNAVTATFDDWLLFDTTTGTQSGELISGSASWQRGPWRMVTTRPSADGTNKNFTPDTGTTNYTRINESTGVDGTTSYVSGQNSGTRDSYTFDAISTDLASPAIATVLKTYARNSAAGQLNYQGLAYKAGNFKLATSQPVPVAFSQIQSHPTFVDTVGAAWTVSNINSSEWGFGIV